MDINKVIRLIVNNNKYSEEEKEIIKGIQEAMLELEVARNSFDNVSDKNLIDKCIYKEDEAKSKYTYFLEQAKNKNIKVSGDTVIEPLEYYYKW